MRDEPTYKGCSSDGEKDIGALCHAKGAIAFLGSNPCAIGLTIGEATHHSSHGCDARSADKKSKRHLLHPSLALDLERFEMKFNAGGRPGSDRDRRHSVGISLGAGADSVRRGTHSNRSIEWELPDVLLVEENFGAIQ